MSRHSHRRGDRPGHGGRPRKILASGFDGYIAKPLDPELFGALVQAHLGVAHPALPLPAPSPAPSLARPQRTLPVRKRAVVLFVDNMQTNIDLVRSVLEPAGYEVFAALSAHEGIDLALRTLPDLIVSDVHMPHQDGYAFLRMVQAVPALAGIPFVFLSSSVWSTREQQQALVRGADKFIPRPIEPGLLLAELEECIKKKKEA